MWWCVDLSDRLQNCFTLVSMCYKHLAVHPLSLKSLGFASVVHTLWALNCNKWKSHAKLSLACDLTFDVFRIEMNLSLINLCFLNVYMVAFIWLHFCHHICEPLPLWYNAFHYFIALLVVLCMWISWCFCSIDVLRAWLCVVLPCAWCLIKYTVFHGRIICFSKIYQKNIF